MVSGPISRFFSLSISVYCANSRVNKYEQVRGCVLQNLVIILSAKSINNLTLLSLLALRASLSPYIKSIKWGTKKSQTLKNTKFFSQAYLRVLHIWNGPNIRRVKITYATILNEQHHWVVSSSETRDDWGSTLADNIYLCKSRSFAWQYPSGLRNLMTQSLAEHYINCIQHHTVLAIVPHSRTGV